MGEQREGDGKEGEGEKERKVPIARIYPLTKG